MELADAGGPLALVGPNGAGKTSVLLMMLGALRPERGRDRGRRQRAVRRREPASTCPSSSVGSATCPRTTRSFRTSRFAERRVRGRELVGAPASPQRDARDQELLADLELDALGERRTARSPAARSSASRWRARSRPARARCCSTNRWPRSTRMRGARCALPRGLPRTSSPCRRGRHARRRGRAPARPSASPCSRPGRIVQIGTWAELEARPASAFVEEFVA